MATTSSLTASNSRLDGKTRAQVLVPALALGLLGIFLIWGVGFSHIDVVHNAAHDTRHSNAFPCH